MSYMICNTCGKANGMVGLTLYFCDCTAKTYRPYTGENSKGDCEYCKKPVTVALGQVWHTKENKVWHETCSYQEQIQKLGGLLQALKAFHPVGPNTSYDAINRVLDKIKDI